MDGVNDSDAVNVMLGVRLSFGVMVTEGSLVGDTDIDDSAVEVIEGEGELVGVGVGDVLVLGLVDGDGETELDGDGVVVTVGDTDASGDGSGVGSSIGSGSGVGDGEGLGLRFLGIHPDFASPSPPQLRPDMTSPISLAAGSHISVLTSSSPSPWPSSVCSPRLLARSFVASST